MSLQIRQLLDHLVEVGLKDAVLHDVVFFEFSFRVGLGDFGCELAGILQDFTVRRGDETIIHERFITAIQTGKQGEPDFARGAEIQKALDACFESERIGQAVKLKLPGSDVLARTRVRKPKNAVP